MAYKLPLKVRVTNQMVTYNHSSDKIDYRTDIKIRAKVKRGYMAYDMTGRNIGIVFSGDDKRLKSYEKCVFLFFADLIDEFGIWRTIKINGDYLPFSRLVKILIQQSEYEFTAD